MCRLIVHVEGETEETFVNEVLRPHLANFGYHSVSARLLGNARQREKRGGIKGWNAVLPEIVRHLREDSGRMSTLMVDYYALPQTGQKAWPGRAESVGLAFEQKASAIGTRLSAQVGSAMGEGFDQSRFIPYITMHEYEALLFSDCEVFAQSIGQPAVGAQLQAVRDAFASPEHINDSPMTAPSKRVSAIVPGYQKPFYGAIAMIGIGLDRVRAACPQFHDWVSVLEASCAHEMCFPN